MPVADAVAEYVDDVCPEMATGVPVVSLYHWYVYGELPLETDAAIDMGCPTEYAPDVGDMDTENAGGGGGGGFDAQYVSLPWLPTVPPHSTIVDSEGQPDGHEPAHSVAPQRYSTLPQAHAGRNATSLRLRTVLLVP